MSFPWRQPAIIQQTQRLLYSFRHWTKRPLLELTGSLIEQSQLLFDADFVVVSHGTESDPIFNYGNGKALELWRLSWDEFIQTPSRKTAEPVAQPERSQMLSEAASKGFISHYSGVRISSQGERFKIDDGIIWEVVDEMGRRYGQAAVFSNYEFL
ncbi:MAG: MEKHLA domain-containing protein [Leptolyngbyaceae cyanobacterium MO_188.B28]|nr:MEKHLA domain-containing protein [Leptolyngbyaceae cyanobacterium MO_188.B28]